MYAPCHRQAGALALSVTSASVRVAAGDGTFWRCVRTHAEHNCSLRVAQPDNWQHSGSARECPGGGHCPGSIRQLSLTSITVYWPHSHSYVWTLTPGSVPWGSSPTSRGLRPQALHLGQPGLSMRECKSDIAHSSIFGGWRANARAVAFARRRKLEGRAVPLNCSILHQQRLPRSCTRRCER
jgi:hypothetical protein